MWQRRGLNSTRLIRSFNAKSVLQILYKEGSATRTRLAKVTKMSPATITRIMEKLIAQKIIIEESVGESTGGRRPIIFRLNYNRLFVAGVRIFRDQVALAVSDLKGKLLAKRVFQQYSLEPNTLFAELTTEFNRLLVDSKIDRGQILGIGVAITGIVDSAKGILIRSANLGWRDVKVAELLEHSLGLPVLIENDANAAALAEFWFGGAKDVASMIYIKTAAGVGAGIIYNHELLTGVKGMAGEIGHIPMIPDGHPCRCGQNGCLETYLYLPDVLKRYRQETGEPLEDGAQFFAKYAERQPTAVKLTDEAASALAITISFAEVLLDVEMVVIGDVWGSLGSEFINKVERKLGSIFENNGLNKTVITIGSQLGEETDLRGAVGLVINEWFTPPIRF
jgi:N-acetylglucosamine repressor